jgi:hypothetical protein
VLLRLDGTVEVSEEKEVAARAAKASSMTLPRAMSVVRKLDWKKCHCQKYKKLKKNFVLTRATKR